MGILTDLFVSTPENALAYEDLMQLEAITPDKFDRARFTGLTDLNFSILWAILTNEAWDLKAHSLEEVYVRDQGEVWLCRFPNPLVSRLASLSSSEMSSAAEAWARTEELDCEPSDIAPVIAELVRLAKAADASGGNLYLWGSL